MQQLHGQIESEFVNKSGIFWIFSWPPLSQCKPFPHDDHPLFPKLKHILAAEYLYLRIAGRAALHPEGKNTLQLFPPAPQHTADGPDASCFKLKMFPEYFRSPLPKCHDVGFFGQYDPQSRSSQVSLFNIRPFRMQKQLLHQIWRLRRTGRQRRSLSATYTVSV